MRNTLGYENIIINCSFIECSSNCCGAIDINSLNKCNTKSVKSVFEKKIAFEDFTGTMYSQKAGAIYVTSESYCNIQIQNCMFKSNKAVYLGGSIHLSNTNYSIEGSCFINMIDWRKKQMEVQFISIVQMDF